MKLTKVMLSLATLALGAASAASSYEVKLYDPIKVGATELKPGDYTIVMQGDKAVLKSGKTVVEVPATLGSSDKKYASTAVLTLDKKLTEIDLGGTKSKIVITPEAVASRSTSAGQ
jgi:hypothetical protein